MQKKMAVLLAFAVTACLTHGLISTARAQGVVSGDLYLNAGVNTSLVTPISEPAGVVYTLVGDTNLEGIVSGTDFAILALNFNTAVTGWNQGDFNYDGASSGSDFAVLAANFNEGANQSSNDPSILSFAAANGLTDNLPEPASLGLLLLAPAAILTRRGARPSTK